MEVNQAKYARSQYKARKESLPRLKLENYIRDNRSSSSSEERSYSNGTGFSTYATSKNFRALSLTSSIYTSIRAESRKNEDGNQKNLEFHVSGAQYPPRPMSAMTTETGISLDGYPANNCIGYKKQLCQTDSEHKAQKLNRSEECKLESYKSRVHKEQKIREKQWSQSTHSFRTKSARMFERSTPKSNSGKDVSTVRSKKQRPQSSPAYVSFLQQRPKDIREHCATEDRRRKERTCSTCEYMKRLIQMYEDHIGELESDTGVKDNHSRFSFSDRQVKTFMHLLETEYCSEIPKMRELLHNGGLRLDQATSDNNAYRCAEHDNGIQNRIRQFCSSQETFNKEHPLPEYIKKGMENVRIAQAILEKRQHVENRRTMIVKEARQKLGILRL
ncbi:uncharacterized protein [Argopecten irradians]|uniref:uncharacterized protein n=1 Tax=Argopecten irradians TaxID=31199 RepID=UPI00372469B0